MRVILASIFLLFAAVPAAAAPPDRISLHLGSHHIGAEREFEEVNPGIFFTWDRRLSYTFGAFRNSYGDLSVAATVAYPLILEPHYRLDVFAGWANYPGEGRDFWISYGDVVPVAGLRFHYRNLFVQFLPADGDIVDGIVSFGVSLPLRHP